MEKESCGGEDERSLRPPKEGGGGGERGTLRGKKNTERDYLGIKMRVHSGREEEKSSAKGPVGAKK